MVSETSEESLEIVDEFYNVSRVPPNYAETSLLVKPSYLVYRAQDVFHYYRVYTRRSPVGNLIFIKPIPVSVSRGFVMTGATEAFKVNAKDCRMGRALLSSRCTIEEMFNEYQVPYQAEENEEGEVAGILASPFGGGLGEGSSSEERLALEMALQDEILSLYD